MKRTVWAITHCESCYNRAQLFTGRIDSRLTENGHKHAGEMAKKLMNANVEVAYRSSLRRTKETLDHILKYHDETEVRVDDRIIERDYGDLSGLSKEKYRRDHPDLFPVYHRSYDVAPPGGESIKQVEKRVLGFIEDMLAMIRSRKVNVLVVCHSNSMRPLRRYFEGLSVDQMMQLEYQRHQIFDYRVEVGKG